jgi:hypothetical protein
MRPFCYEVLSKSVAVIESNWCTLRQARRERPVNNFYLNIRISPLPSLPKSPA